MEINSILNDYRNGDFDTRLSLFLNFRDLRHEFMAIDESEFNLQRTVPEKEKGIRHIVGKAINIFLWKLPKNKERDSACVNCS